MEASLPRYSLLTAFIVQTAIVFASNAGVFGGKTNPELAKKYKTLVTPATFAFSIWGLIYTTELVGCGLVFLQRHPPGALEEAAPFWIAANVAQTLWALAFSREWLLTSAALLFTITLMLVLALEEYRAWPLSLHAGWCTVATLLNVNLCLTKSDASVQLAAAFGTLYAAVVAALLALTLRGDAFFAAAIAWACFAIFKELPANNAIPDLDMMTRRALRLTSAVAAAAITHLSLSALLYARFVEPF